LEVLCRERPYDGRRGTLAEKRGGWRYTGLTGVLRHLSLDGREAAFQVENDPDDYWPAGMIILVELGTSEIGTTSFVEAS
jgi:hypothetical protein